MGAAPRERNHADVVNASRLRWAMLVCMDRLHSMLFRLVDVAASRRSRPGGAPSRPTGPLRRRGV